MALRKRVVMNALDHVIDMLPMPDRGRSRSLEVSAENRRKHMHHGSNTNEKHIAESDRQRKHDVHSHERKAEKEPPPPAPADEIAPTKTISFATAFTLILETVLLCIIGCGVISVYANLFSFWPVADTWAVLSVSGSVVCTFVLFIIVMCVGSAVPDAAQFLKEIGRACCCSVFVVLLVYIVLVTRATSSVMWRDAFFAVDTFSLVMSAGVLAFLSVVLLLVSLLSFTCTLPGQGNALFLNLCTVAGLVLTYPVLHEIANSGLLMCTDEMNNTFAFIYVNLAVATSMLLYVLDVLEFNPEHLLPKFMVGSSAGIHGGVRVYNILHGLILFAFITCYILLARNILEIEQWFAAAIMVVLLVIMFIDGSAAANSTDSPSLT
jgi:hypothetical protein